jgi:hypothetical protein
MHQGSGLSQAASAVAVDLAEVECVGQRKLCSDGRVDLQMEQ